MSDTQVRYFSYQGDHPSVSMHGVDFPRLIPIGVPVSSKALIHKLQGNSHWQEHSADEVEVAGPALKLLAENAAREASLAKAAELKRGPGRPKKDEFNEED